MEVTETSIDFNINLWANYLNALSTIGLCRSQKKKGGATCLGSERKDLCDQYGNDNRRDSNGEQ